MSLAPEEAVFRALLKKHRLPFDVPIEQISRDGSVNWVRLAGDYCVRILREADFESDIWTESVAVPAIVAAGVKTPRLVVFDTDGDIVDSLVTIYERVPGVPLGEIPWVSDPCEIYMAAAAEAKQWTERVTEIDDPKGRLDSPQPINLAANFMRQKHRIDAPIQTVIQKIVDRLAKFEPLPPSFVHWDLHAHNLMVKDNRLSAIIDWGDCGFADPAINFTCFPAEYLPEVLQAFGNETPEMIAGVIRETLGYALNGFGVSDDPRTPLRPIGRSRWRSFMALRRRSRTGVWKEILAD